MSDKNIEMARRLAVLVAQNGGTAYYVGGYVRDLLMHRDNKDIDIEIHGIRPAKLEALLDSLGPRIAIGESFGIYALKGYSLDIALPRTEHNRGRGHRDFDIFTDPFIGTYKAAERRDFTINALMQNILTGEIVDCFGGVDDLKNGVLRHISDKTFVEDPLRVLRAAQFAARFNFAVARETKNLCRTMDISALPKERVFGELKKALLKSDSPSVFFKTLRDMNCLSVWFGELERTIGVEQSPEHHPEGDVFNHTMLVVDAAAKLREKAANPLGFMLAALCHDFGKTLCTARGEDGKIHAIGHETLGLPLIKTFLHRLTDERELIRYVLNLCENHMRPNMLAAGNSSVKATNKMFDSAFDPTALICLAECDTAGKAALCGYKNNTAFLTERLGIYNEYMSRPYVTGRDLIAAGLEPNERFSQYLAHAHKLRLAGVSKQNAMSEILALARKSGDYPPTKQMK